MIASHWIISISPKLEKSSKIQFPNDAWYFEEKNEDTWYWKKFFKSFEFLLFFKCSFQCCYHIKGLIFSLMLRIKGNLMFYCTFENSFVSIHFLFKYNTSVLYTIFFIIIIVPYMQILLLFFFRLVKHTTAIRNFWICFVQKRHFKVLTNYGCCFMLYKAKVTKKGTFLPCTWTISSLNV